MPALLTSFYQAKMIATPKRILPVIVLSQFLCTTLWFCGNAVLTDLTNQLHLPSSALASITSSVQFGFITGTLLYTLLTIADRFKPSLVFFMSAVLAAIANATIVFSDEFSIILLLRFCTGFFLAGIYPVGMKIAADHYEKGLGKALGYLVGALVLGTAFPHLLKNFSVALSWKYVLIAVSVLSFAGGILMWLTVPAGPYRKPMQKPHFTLFIKVFKPKAFRSAALGYFGHMWELYTFWAFVPVIVHTYMQRNKTADMNVSFIAFVVIAAGAIACVTSGYISQKIGTERTAFIALLCSGLCCLFSPFSFQLPLVPFILFLLFWGWMVVADSPMFSTLVAQNAIGEEKGTALTIVTCIGFFITIVSITVLNELKGAIKAEWLYVVLLPGPFFGLLGMSKWKQAINR